MKTAKAPPQHKPEPLLVDLREAARLLGVSPRTVRVYVREAGLPHTRTSDGTIGAKLLFSPAKLQEWVATRLSAK